MSNAEPIAVIDAIASLDPGLLSRLSDLEVLTLAHMWEEARLRPIQKPPTHDWRFCGFVGGRGFGKSLAIAAEITKRIYAGVAPSLALMAPNEERVEQVQVRALIEVAPPWFKPVRHLGGVEWPNGARANIFTPEAGGRPRGDNVAVSWLTELVDWTHTKRLDAFNNVTTATRLGCSQVFWDSTSKGRNDLILARVRENQEDPYTYPIVRGTTFDNPLLSDKYLREEWRKYTGVRRREELFGEVFSEAAGALFEQAWIDDNHVDAPPAKVESRILSIDPALSDHATADEVGMVRMSLASGAVYIEEDLSARMKPDVWGELVIDQHFKAGVGGVVIERNHLGDNATYVIRSRAREHNVELRMLDRDCKTPMPRRVSNVLYVREYVSGNKKESRASGPASETEQGHVKFVGDFPDLENELTSYEPGVSRSPNRYDAFNAGVNELLRLSIDGDRRGDLKRAAGGADALHKIQEAANPSPDLPGRKLLDAMRGVGSPLSIMGRGRRL